MIVLFGFKKGSDTLIKFVKIYYECCEYAELYKFKPSTKVGGYDEGGIVLSGDWYHNKISDRIEAYLQAYKDMKIEFELIEDIQEYCNNCKKIIK